MLRRFAGLTLALALLAFHAYADETLPRAEDVLDQYVEATGGKAAYEKIKNRVTKGFMEITGSGVKGKITSFQAAPNLGLLEIDVEGIAKAREGCNGQVVWEVSQLTGDRLIEGDEREEKLLRNQFLPEIRWRDLYAKVECTGIEDVNGKPAYKILITPRSNQIKPWTEYYDKASKLQVKVFMTPKSSMGTLTIESYPSDYKAVDGVLIAHKITQKVAAQEIVIVLSEIKQNVDLPAETFAIPEPIKALMEKKNSEKEKKASN